MTSKLDDCDRLRFNSRAKHLILREYLGGWITILSQRNKRLNYFDCFAGPGEYFWQENLVDGSPIESLNVCRELLSSLNARKPDEINLDFIDDDETQLEKLDSKICDFGELPKGLNIQLHLSKSQDFVEDILNRFPDLAPSFFFIDPYGQPFPLEVMKAIMARQKTEIMLNFMYYQFIRDLRNPKKVPLCQALFHPDNPRTVVKNLMRQTGRFDEFKILDYLHLRIGAKYYIPFWVMFGPDERVKASRVKYFLVHYSNHFAAFQLMLSIMWKHSDPGQPLLVADRRPVLFPSKDVSELEYRILQKYQGTDTKITFQDFMEKNWRWYFLEKHYREVLKKLRSAKKIIVTPVDSRTGRGLAGRDIIKFI